MELRALQRRKRDTTVKTRVAGRPKGKPSYGFPYVRVVTGGKIDRIALHPHASVGHLAVMYGERAGGNPRQPTSPKNILLSEAALGCLMHRRRPVIDQDGNPVRLCEGPWDRSTHEALKHCPEVRDTPFKGRRSGREYLLTEVALCGLCGNRLYTQSSADVPPRYVCTARNKGWLSPALPTRTPVLGGASPAGGQPLSFLVPQAG
ncbi:hypothetical protein [Streptomyces qinzhouensis]|uniref:Recombinase domain-containing protein n=1 Tax=Streptomyces qinzhouensis TaxID=2599401 RepID=A0A5B8J6K0_9ACTN|nr:hypothetical protein [Streptomyces qinzhouensis]QDY75661.1 hypothetical protein FQU76_03075 [Streptomyces qinzhouensis]